VECVHHAYALVASCGLGGTEANSVDWPFENIEVHKSDLLFIASAQFSLYWTLITFITCTSKPSMQYAAVNYAQCPVM
jgi:hypothetical protein